MERTHSPFLVGEHICINICSTLVCLVRHNLKHGKSYERVNSVCAAPNFATDITIRTYESMNLPGRSLPDRVLIPITDDSATVIFYLISDKKIALKYKIRK